MCAGIPCSGTENNGFDVNCGKMKDWIYLDMLGRSITNHNDYVRVYNKKVIKCIYRKIFITRKLMHLSAYELVLNILLYTFNNGYF